jgi:MoaA/NifB/PqqE/SkfB family radical SAM enzyme
MKLEAISKKRLLLERKYREARMFAKALRSPRHPILAHMVPMRRCNLSCTYCNEYDKDSLPVPTAEMLSRVDRLAKLGTTILHLSGGEPMLHPELDEIIKRIRSHNMLAGILTNGYFLNPKRIKELNRAGLDHLQISVDNVQPDETSKKSLKVLDKRLRYLSEYADFDVNINSVVGSELDNPEDALTIANRAVELGLTSTVGIIHDHSGQLRPLSDTQRRIYEQINSLGKKVFKAASYDAFQRNMVRGLPTEWDCHAGSRYLYVCENGLVHYCSQQRGTPGIPLKNYGPEDLDRAYETGKECAPYCTISCVHRTGWLDDLRVNPQRALSNYFPDAETPTKYPFPVKVLSWLFVPNGNGGQRLATRVALRLLRLS